MQGRNPTEGVACLAPRPLITAGNRVQAAVMFWRLLTMGLVD